MHLSISNDIVSTKIYDKCDDFDLEIVNFPFLDGHVPVLHPMESIYLNSLVLLEHLAMLLTSKLDIKLLNQKRFKQDYRYHTLRKTFSKVQMIL